MSSKYHCVHTLDGDVASMIREFNREQENAKRIEVTISEQNQIISLHLEDNMIKTYNFQLTGKVTQQTWIS